MDAEELVVACALKHVVAKAESFDHACITHINYLLTLNPIVISRTHKTMLWRLFVKYFAQTKFPGRVKYFRKAIERQHLRRVRTPEQKIAQRKRRLEIAAARKGKAGT